MICIHENNTVIKYDMFSSSPCLSVATIFKSTRNWRKNGMNIVKTQKFINKRITEGIIFGKLKNNQYNQSTRVKIKSSP